MNDDSPSGPTVCVECGEAYGHTYDEFEICGPCRIKIKSQELIKASNALQLIDLLQACAANDLMLTIIGDYDTKEYCIRIGFGEYKRGKTMLEALTKALENLRDETGQDIFKCVSDDPWKDEE